MLRIILGVICGARTHSLRRGRLCFGAFQCWADYLFWAGSRLGRPGGHFAPATGKQLFPLLHFYPQIPSAHTIQLTAGTWLRVVVICSKKENPYPSVYSIDIQPALDIVRLGPSMLL